METIIAFAKLGYDVPGCIPASLQDNAGWLPHFNQKHYQGSWTVLPLRSPGGRCDSITGDLMGFDAYGYTPHIDGFPEIKKLVESMQCPVMSARLLNLKAGSIIKEHRDLELAFERGEARLHFPLITNDRVEFYVNDIRVVMNQGECWYINANLPHRVANYGSTDRIHLVVDCKVNAWLKQLFEQADKTMIKKEDSPEQLRAMIRELRSQQTATASQLADQLELQLPLLP